MTINWPFPSSYPAGLDTYADLTDNVDMVIANHPNSLSSAIEALQNKLGITNAPVVGVGGVSFDTAGKAANPGGVGEPTIWVDNTNPAAFVLKYTDNAGATIELGAGGGSALTDWTDAEAYTENQEVIYLNLRFRARSDHTSSASFFTDLDKWTCVSGEGLIVNQAAHGFIAGQVIYVSTGVWALAQANALSTLSDPPSLIIGVNTDYFLVAMDGLVTLTGHGLTVNSVYYLSPTTPGLLTSTKPVSTAFYLNPILIVRDVNTVIVVNDRPGPVVASPGSIVWNGTTATATPTEIFLGGIVGTRYSLSTNHTVYFNLTCVARDDINNDSKVWDVKAVSSVDSFGNAAIVGTPSYSVVAASAGAAAWSLAATVNDPDDTFRLTVTGAAGVTIQWVVSN